MGRKCLIVILMCFTMFLHAQNKMICGQVEYVQTTHFSMLYSMNFKLFFNQNVSLYEQMNVKQQEESFEKVAKSKGLQINFNMERNNLTPDFYYNDKKHFYYMEVFFDQELMVKDPDLHFKWHLSTETKKVGRFLCQKATTHFRGRDYTAWFAPQIPVTFGPWKFRGLSGLILEVYDKDRVLHIVAKNIKLNEKENCKIKVDKSRFKEAMTIPEFFQKQKELTNEDLMRISTKLSKNPVFTLGIDEDCEECQAERIELFEKK